jgi:toxin FitB
MLESYSVLTRLPGGLAVSGELAADLLRARFPDPPLRLTSPGQRNLVTRLSGAGVIGGSSYDGLVGLEAATHSQTLLTLDMRASGTYRGLDVDFRLLRP